MKASSDNAADIFQSSFIAQSLNKMEQKAIDLQKAAGSLEQRIANRLDVRV